MQETYEALNRTIISLTNNKFALSREKWLINEWWTVDQQGIYRQFSSLWDLITKNNIDERRWTETLDDFLLY